VSGRLWLGGGDLHCSAGGCQRTKVGKLCCQKGREEEREGEEGVGVERVKEFPFVGWEA